MKILSKAVSVLGGISLAALLIAALAPKVTRGVVASLVQVTNTSANPVPIGMATHLGVPPSAFVHLDCSAPPLPNGVTVCQQVLKDGSMAPFTVPAGKNLIVTDVELALTSESLCTGFPLRSIVFIASLSPAPGVARVDDFLAAEPFEFQAFCAAIGNRHYTSGLVFFSGERLGAVLDVGFSLDNLSIHGYLTNEE
jgi:hypothetical protein